MFTWCEIAWTGAYHCCNTDQFFFCFLSIHFDMGCPCDMPVLFCAMLWPLPSSLTLGEGHILVMLIWKISSFCFLSKYSSTLYNCLILMKKSPFEWYISVTLTMSFRVKFVACMGTTIPLLMFHKYICMLFSIWCCFAIIYHHNVIALWGFCSFML